MKALIAALPFFLLVCQNLIGQPSCYDGELARLRPDSLNQLLPQEKVDAYVATVINILDGCRDIDEEGFQKMEAHLSAGEEISRQSHYRLTDLLELKCELFYNRSNEKLIITLNELIHLYGSNPEREAWALDLLGYAYNQQQKFDQALDFYFQSLDIYSKQKDFIGLSNVYNSLSAINMELENWELAERFLSKANEFAAENSQSLAYNFMNRGLVDLYLGDYRSAKDQLTKAIGLRDELEYPHTAYLYMAEYFNVQPSSPENLNLARAFLDSTRRSLTIRGELVLVEFYNQVAQNELNFGNFQSSKDSALISAGLIHAHMEAGSPLPQDAKLTYEILAESYSQLGRLDSAAFYYVERLKVEDRMSAQLKKVASLIHSREIESKNEVIAKQQLIDMGILIFTGSFLVVSALYFMRLRKRKTQLVSKNKEISNYSELLNSMITELLRKLVELGEENEFLKHEVQPLKKYEDKTLKNFEEYDEALKTVVNIEKLVIDKTMKDIKGSQIIQIGDNSGGNTINQNQENYQKFEEEISEMDPLKLIAELKNLLTEMENTRPPGDYEHIDALRAVEQAQMAAEAKDKPKLFEFLNRAGKKALSIAESIGLKVAEKAIMTAMLG